MRKASVAGIRFTISTRLRILPADPWKPGGRFIFLVGCFTSHSTWRSRMCVQELGAKWLWSHCIVQGAAARLEGEVGNVGAHH